MTVIHSAFSYKSKGWYFINKKVLWDRFHCVVLKYNSYQFSKKPF